MPTMAPMIGGGTGNVGDPAEIFAASVFLSYSRVDVETARWLQVQLVASGISVFRDVDDTLAGELWWKRVTELIAAAQAVVFVLSPNSAASKVCADEVEFAQSFNKRIFPVVIAPIDWSHAPNLGRYHAVSLVAEQDRAAGVAQLVRALNTDLDWVRMHTRLLDRARQWQFKGKPASELLVAQALQDAEQWLADQPASAEAPTPVHQAYIKASRDEERLQQERSVAEAEQRRAAMQAERDNALRSQSIFLARQSREETGRQHFDLGIKLALQALPKSLDTPDRPWTQTAHNALLSAVAGQVFRTTVGAPHLAGEEALKAAAVSADGKRAALDHATQVVLYNLETGEEITALRADLHGAVASLAFSPDARLLVVSYTTHGNVMYAPGYNAEVASERGGVLEIVDCDDGSTLAKFQVRGHQHSHVAFSASGRCLLFATDRSLAIVDIESEHVDVIEWQEKALEFAPPYIAVAFSPDEHSVAVITATGFGGVIDLAGRIFYDLFSTEAALSGVGFVAGAGEARVVVGMADKVNALIPRQATPEFESWGGSDGDPLVALVTTKDHDAAIAITRRGRVLSWSDGRPTTMMEAMDAAHSPGAGAGERSVRAARIGRLGSAAIVELDDGSIEHWMLRAAKRALVLGADSERKLIDAGFAENEKLAFIATSDDCLRLWEPLDGQPAERTILSGPRKALRVAWRPGRTEGSQVAIAFDDGTIELRDPERDAVLWQGRGMHEAGAEIRHIAFDRAGTRLVSTSLDKTAVIWRLDDNGAPLRLTGHTRNVEFAAFSPDDTLIVTGSCDCTFRLWSAATGAAVKVLATPQHFLDPIHNASINPHAAFTSDGRWLVTVTSGDGLAITQPALVWEVASGTLLHAFEHQNGAIWQMLVTPDDRYVVTASYDCTAAIWDLRVGGRIRTLSGHASPVVRTEVSHGGQLLTTISSDGDLRVWQLPSGRLIHNLQIGRGSVRLAVSGDGESVATSCAVDDDGSRIDLWDLREGVILLSLSERCVLGSGMDALCFSPDDRSLLARTKSGELRSWSLPPAGQALIDLGWRRVHRQPGDELLSAEQRIRFSLESA